MTLGESGDGVQIAAYWTWDDDHQDWARGRWRREPVVMAAVPAPAPASRRRLDGALALTWAVLLLILGAALALAVTGGAR